MEQDFFGCSCSKFPEAMEQLKSGSVFFPDGMLQRKFVFHFDTVRSRFPFDAQAAQAQCVSLIINTCSFILRNLKWP